jgi:hypothetical protein
MTLSAGQIMEYGEKQALAAIFRQAQSPAAGNTWLALLTAAPASGADLTMAAETEYAPTGGYARQVYGPGAPSSASPSVISNGGSITWGPFTGTVTGTVSWAMCCDAATGTAANLIAAYLLASSRTPAAGDSLQSAVSGFTAQL